MQLSMIIEDLESSLADLRRTQAKMDILQRALGHFDECSDSGWVARPGAYSYIPLDLGDFVHSLVEADACLRVDPAFRRRGAPYRPVHFLEIGCGIGRNLFVAKHGRAIQLASVTGIDIAPQYIAQARQFFFLSEQEVQVADAMKFDYSRFDLVYFYRPFSDETLEAKFERRLIKQLRPGAYVIAHLNAVFERIKALEVMEPTYRIWRKKQT